MAKRVYELWKGSNKFFLGGRLIFGPDARSLLITLLLVTVPVSIFCVFVARHLRHQFSPHDAGYAVLVAPIVFTIIVLVLLLLTSARDPGIVPRNAHPPEEEIRYDTSASADVGGRQTPSLQFPRTKEVIVNGIPRNYRFFFCFVSSATLLCIYVFAMCAFYIKVLMDDNRSSVWKAMKESPASAILMLYCFISLWFVGGLTGFHSFLIITNQTTYENFRYRSDNRPNIYDRGCWNNAFEVFCTKVNPSKNNFRAFVQEEETQQGPPPTTAGEAEETGDDIDRRAKVENDHDIGGDLLRISRRHDIEDIDIRSRGGSDDVSHHNNSSGVDDSVLGGGSFLSTSRGRSGGSWEREIVPEVMHESRSCVGASKEASLHINENNLVQS